MMQRAEQLAREATQIFAQHQDAVMAKIMADGKVDANEVAEVAGNMVAGLKPEDAEPVELAGALMLLCMTVAELAEDAGGVPQGQSGALAKEAFPQALMWLKQQLTGGAQ